MRTTITPEQCHAIRVAFEDWIKVCQDEGYDPHVDVQAVRQAFAMISKSCLMGRMLYQGRDPLEEKPPVKYAAPQYHLLDPDLCEFCGGPKGEPGRSFITSMNKVYKAPMLAVMEEFESDRPVGNTVAKLVCSEAWHGSSW